MPVGSAKASGEMRQRSDDDYGQLLILPELQYAHAAALRLLEPHPPIVTLVGPAGCGKTHLVRAIVREMGRRHPQIEMQSVTADAFHAEFVGAAKVNGVPAFQEKYRESQVFVCEDLQVLEDRGSTQQQLLAVIDEVTTQGGRCLLSSSKAIGQLEGLSAKLKNRCLGGVCAAIESPGKASREKLLTLFAQQRCVVLPNDLASNLAEAFDVSARELRGIVMQLEAMSRQYRRPIDRDIAQAVTSHAVQSAKPTLAQITRVVAREFRVSAADLKSPGRLRGIVLPRQLAMFAAREWAEQGYAEIGKHFRRRSHSTIVHACQRIAARLRQDADFRQLVEGIRE
ncbi:MAG: AAA family ATPase, partial [Planctomycetaceae bacterium]|nr:AAA family ATPase [Planctomycetaceae bacterium]